jgi:uncharacterized protein
LGFVSRFVSACFCWNNLAKIHSALFLKVDKPIMTRPFDSFGSDRPRPAKASPVQVQPLTDPELDELQSLLDNTPAPLAPLDVSMVDGFLCGVLLQPEFVPTAQWLPFITDEDGRALPAAAPTDAHFNAARLHALVLRRYAELQDAIAARQWFDPWVFELEADEYDADSQSPEPFDDEDPPPIDAVYPWVAGFATAMEVFPDLMSLDKITEPLALVYRHLAPDDLEDADELLAEIESLEPPTEIGEAVEGLVRATLLLADISRPLLHPSQSANRLRRLGGYNAGRSAGKPSGKPPGRR